MYFLSDEERSFLSGRVLPEARRQGVHPELRGWNWQQPPLVPAYDVRLTVPEIADRYCDSGRDIYLRRVLALPWRPNAAMCEDAALRRALADTIVRAKQVIYQYGPAECLAHLHELAEPRVEEMMVQALGAEHRSTTLAAWPGTGTSGTLTATRAERAAEVAALQLKVAALVAFERQRIIARVHDVLVREPDVGTDALVALALPITVERLANGVFLGLASHVAVDASGTFEGIVFDVQFGEQREFHRLRTTAYAMVLESLYGQPLDVGAVVYVTFSRGRVQVERDLHAIDDELRQWFIEERDERSRLVSEEIDPGKASACHTTCPYWWHCHGS